VTRRKTPGEVVAYDLDGDSILNGDTLWLRGPLTDDEAREGAASLLAGHGLDGHPGEVRHVRARFVPRRDDYDRWLEVLLGEGRGTFPVVIVTIGPDPACLIGSAP